MSTVFETAINSFLDKNGVGNGTGAAPARSMGAAKSARRALSIMAAPRYAGARPPKIAAAPQLRAPPTRGNIPRLQTMPGVLARASL